MAAINENKKKSFQEIRDKIPHYQPFTDENLNKSFFRTHDSLRLTLTGYKVFRAAFREYKFELPASIKSKHRIAMAHLEFPYFLSSQRLILFYEMDVIAVKLAGLENFLENTK